MTIDEILDERKDEFKPDFAVRAMKELADYKKKKFEEEKEKMLEDLLNVRRSRAANNNSDNKYFIGFGQDIFGRSEVAEDLAMELKKRGKNTKFTQYDKDVAFIVIYW